MLEKDRIKKGGRGLGALSSELNGLRLTIMLPVETL